MCVRVCNFFVEVSEEVVRISQEVCFSITSSQVKKVSKDPLQTIRVSLLPLRRPVPPAMRSPTGLQDGPELRTFMLFDEHISATAQTTGPDSMDTGLGTLGGLGSGGWCPIRFGAARACNWIWFVVAVPVGYRCLFF